MNQLSLLKAIISDISGLLESDEFLNAHRFPNRFVRKRKLIFALTVTKSRLQQKWTI